MRELIDRQAAIDVLKQFKPEIIPYEKARSYVEETIDTMYNRIEELPTIQPEPQWIPVSERLPEPRIDVWVNSDLGQMVGYYDETVELWYGRDYLELIVNAWMPLPSPYQKGVTP